jgi:hypothetical protein
MVAETLCVVVAVQHPSHRQEEGLYSRCRTEALEFHDSSLVYKHMCEDITVGAQEIDDCNALKGPHTPQYPPGCAYVRRTCTDG